VLDTTQVIYNTYNHHLFKYRVRRNFVESRRLLTCNFPFESTLGNRLAPLGLVVVFFYQSKFKISTSN